MKIVKKQGVRMISRKGLLQALILVLFSCKDYTVSFDVSQPENVKNQKEFQEEKMIKRMLKIFLIIAIET